MADFAVTSEEVLRRLIAMERAYAGRPTNERARRRRHHAPRARKGQARVITFTLTAALTTVDASATVTINDFFDGKDPNPGGGTFSVFNTQSVWAAGIGKKGAAIYDPENDKYWIMFLECP